MKACQVYIYALVDKRSTECLYVGQTENLWRRIAAHHTGARRTEFKHCGCVVLRATTRSDALRIENQVIASFHRRSKARLNVVRGVGAVYVVNEDLVIPTMRAAMAAFGVSNIDTMKKWIREGKAWQFNRKGRKFTEPILICLYDPKKQYVWSGYSI